MRLSMFEWRLTPEKRVRESYRTIIQTLGNESTHSPGSPGWLHKRPKWLPWKGSVPEQSGPWVRIPHHPLNPTQEGTPEEDEW